MTKLTTQFLVEKLGHLVNSRFKSIKEINEHLTYILDTDCGVVNKTRYNDEAHLDFNLIGLVNTVNIYCNFDLYYIKDNAGELFITRLAYEFE